LRVFDTKSSWTKFLAISPKENFLFASNWSGNNISIIDLLYFSDMGKNKIFRLNLKNDKIEEFAKTDNNPNTIALTPDKKVLIVSNRGKNNPSGNYNIPGPEWGSILFFDTSTGKMLDALLAGNQPTALAVSPDGNLTLCQLPSFEEFLAGGGGRSSIYRQEIKK
jgi:DNA-binding beta-propeller fold protein YncE